MLSSISSFLFPKEEEPTTPPPVTITGVRIPADGTPAHLLPLTTIPDPGPMDDFLFHVPDVRRYWNTGRGRHRLDLLPHDHTQLLRHLQQKHELLQRLMLSANYERRGLLYLGQRYFFQTYRVLRPQHASCAGTYYVFYSFAVDDLPRNSSVPAWFSDSSGCCGDVFVVKMAPWERGERGWAEYEDINPQFLDFLEEGPVGG